MALTFSFVAYGQLNLLLAWQLPLALIVLITGQVLQHKLRLILRSEQ